ncbi:MAG: WD40 repeat domain-containing serine/threonine-protein kinase [Gemmataceae bacterium]
MSTAGSKSEIVLALAEEFLERYRKGERPALKEYADKHPDLADDIRDVFPAMAMMENIALADESLAERASGGCQPPGLLTQIGDYRVLREVGRGGMGVVYEAEQVSLGRHVALKLLPRAMLRDATTRRRFEREAKAAAKLHHTNIVPVFGVGEDDGQPYYVMQFIRGHALDDVLAEVKRLHTPDAPPTAAAAADVARSLVTGSFGTQAEAAADEPPAAPSSPSGSTPTLPGQTDRRGRKLTYWQSVARIGAQIADALDYAHRQGILHRDVKPSNLLLDGRGTPWVTDFGLAKSVGDDNLTHTGDILGTLRYMPPEAFEGRADARGDVYSLGITLYEMLALQPAYGERDRARLVRQVTTEEPPALATVNPAIPRDLRTIVAKASEKDITHRYQTAGELADDLGRFAADEPIRARTVGPAERVWRWCRRNPLVAGLLATVVGLLVAVAATASVGYARTVAALAEADEVKAIALAERDRANANLYRSLIGEIRATRAARGEGFRSRVWDLIGQARAVDSDQYDANVLRSEAVGCLGDFAGFPPVVQAGFPAPVTSMALDPQSQDIALGLVDGTILFRHRTTGADGVRLRRHSRPVIGLKFIPDSSRLMTYDTTGQIKLWGRTGGGWECRRTIPPQPGRLTAYPFLVRADRLLVCAPTETGGHVLDCESGEPIAPFEVDDPKYPPFGVAPDQKETFGTTADGVAVWDVATRKVVRRASLGGVQAGVLTVSPDGRTLACGLVGTGLRVFDWPDLKPRANRRTGELTEIAFHPDGRTFAAISFHDKTVQVWDSAAVEPLAVLPFPYTQSARGNTTTMLGFSYDGGALVAADASSARTWDLAAASERRWFADHADGVSGVAFSPDGRSLASASRDQTVVVRDVATGAPRYRLTGFGKQIQDARFSPDGRLLATCDYAGKVRLWAADGGAEVGVVAADLITSELAPTVYDVTFSPDGRYLAATGSGMALFRLTPDPTKPAGVVAERVAFKTGRRSLTCAFSPDGRWLAWLDLQSVVRLWDVEAKREAAFAGPRVLDGWTALAYHPRRNHLYYVAQSGQAEVWDVAANQRVRAIGPPGRFINGGLKLNHDGRYMAVVARSQQLSIWDAEADRELFALPRERSSPWKRTWHPTDNRLAMGLSSGEVVLWDIDRVRAILDEIGLAP